MSKYTGHHAPNQSRGGFSQYPSGTAGGPAGPGGAPMSNNAQGQGLPQPGRMGFPTGRNMVPMGLNYHAGGNPGPGSGPGGPGGSGGPGIGGPGMGGGYQGQFTPSSGISYNNNNSTLSSNSIGSGVSTTSNAQMPYGHASQHTTPTHSPYSSSPSSSAYPNSTKALSSAPLRRYILLPPPKRRKLHRTSDLGFPGVFPQRAGQDEDQMTSNNVKTGYIDKGIIQNETVSAQGILADGLHDPKKLHDLGAFMVEVLKKRLESSRIAGPSTFRPPSRATLNDQKKEQWMSDLSGTVSLRRLCKSVPHGFKSEKLLETLAQRQVPMLRATWYIKIVALSEMQAQRSRPSSTQHQYSTDWTMTVNMFLKKQLQEINPHSTSRPASSTLNPASGTQNIKPWASEEAKEKWEAKWRYSVMLTKWQYNEGLLDHRHFLRATVEQLSTLGFEQVALLLSLISMFLTEYARSRLLMRLLIEGLLNTLQSVQRHPSYKQPVFRYAYLELELKRMLQSIFLSTPDMFVIPKAWATHSNLLQKVLLQDIQATHLKPAVFPNVELVMETHYKMIHARVHVFTDLTPGGSELDHKSARPGNNVDILDRVDHTSDLEQVAQEYFGEATNVNSSTSIPPSPSASTIDHNRPASPLSSHAPSPTPRSDATWKSLVNTLCEWAITNSRYGHHRVYLAASLLSIWRESPALPPYVPIRERTSRLQCALLEFLDLFNGTHHQASQHHGGMHNHHHHQHHDLHSAHGSEDTLDAMARLFGNLIHDRLFSYQQYLQRLIARGDLQHSKRNEESTLRHLKYLQSFPLHREAQAQHLNHRRVVLFGVNGEDEYDRECFETITAQIKARLPYMFSPEATSMTVPIKDSPQDRLELAMPLSVQLTELILSASRFCQLRVTSRWLVDAVKSYVVKHIQIGEDNWRVMTSPGSSLLNARQFATVVNVMEVADDFHSLYEMCTWLLDHTSDRSLLTYVVNIAKKHYMVWASMGVLTKFSQVILAKHYNLQGKNVLFKALPRYLAFEAHNVPEDIRLQMEGDLACAKTFTGVGATLPTQLQELQTLLKDSSSSAVSSLASSLHFKYGGSTHWPLQLFDQCVEALRKLDATIRTGGLSANDLMNGSSMSTAAVNLEVVRASRLYAELLVEMAERAGNGCMNDVVLHWLRLHDFDWMTSVLGAPRAVGAEDAPQEGHPVWFLSFMVQLVIQGFSSIEVLVQDMCGAVLSKIANTVRQPFPDSDDHGDHLTDMHQDSQHQVAPDESLLRLCLTMIILLRLLLLEDAFSNTRTSHGYGATQHTLSMEHHPHRLGIRLTIAEIHALQTQRYSRLMAMQQQSCQERNVETADTTAQLTASCAERQMMLIQFQICRDLIWIESCLPLNHKVLHEIQEYRKDWALSADWLREKCLANVDGAYKMFLQTKQGQQQQNDRLGTLLNGDGTNDNSSNGSAKIRKTHFEIVDRKMMETFQMLVAENHESLLLMDTYGDTALTPNMVHQRTFRSIFSRVDRWIFDRCKVEFWLLLDNVMMGRTAMERRLGGDGSVDKERETVDASGSSASTSMSSGGPIMMEGVAMASGTGGPSQATNGVELPDGGMKMSTGREGDTLQQLIQIFFREFVLSENADKELLGRMLIGMRTDAVEEFIRHGYSILAGSPDSAFPENVMVVPRSVSSTDHIKIVANFHYVMELLMNEGQPTIPLSLIFEESAGQSSAAVATPSASTPSASSSQPTNANSNPASAALQGLDAAQLENRIGFAKSLLWQLKKFEDRIKFFDVMHAIGCSYKEACKVLQDSETVGADMEELLLNASMQRHLLTRSHSHVMSENHQYQPKPSQSSATDLPSTIGEVQLIDLRTSLCLRLRLLVPLLPVILQHPYSTDCDLSTYVIRLTNLLVSSIVHGQGSEERLFEFCLDMVSCLMDEVLLLSGGLSGGGNDSKAMRNDILNQLRTGLPQMTTSIPTVFASRIFRILPFQQHNVYFTGLRAADEVGSKVIHKDLQPRPWDWLEDCVGDVDLIPQHQLPQQQQQPSHSPALGLGPQDVGSSSSVSGLVNGEGGGGLVGTSSSLLSGSSSSLSSTLAASSAALGTLAENANDTSISLTFFGAKQVRKSTEGTTYETQFSLGHGGGDDEQELILVEEQQRPYEYDHSHQQHLLLLQHQQKQERLLLQQQQEEQQMMLQRQAEVIMEGGQNMGLAQTSNMMEMDLFGPGSSGGGIRSGSVPPLPRQQEPDPELEEGQILNDEDLDMNAMAWESNGAINDSNCNSNSNDGEVSFQKHIGQAIMTATSTVTGTEEGEVVEGEVVEKKVDATVSMNALSGSTASTVATSAASSSATAATSKKKSSSSSKAARGAAGASHSNSATSSSTASAATTKAARGKGGRGSKGSKSAQTAEAAAATSGAIAVTSTASSISAEALSHTGALSSSPPLMISETTPPVPQQQLLMHHTMQAQQFHGQTQQFQQLPPQQQSGFQNQMRGNGGMMQPPLAMSVALPPQGQPSALSGSQSGFTNQQLMNIMRQGQNAAAAAIAAAASSGSNGGLMGLSSATPTIGGVHVPFLNGQHQHQLQGQQGQQGQQGPQLQQQYMDPLAFLNNGGKPVGLAFNPGNPMNIHLGQLNNNNNNSGSGSGSGSGASHSKGSNISGSLDNNSNGNNNNAW